MTSHHRRLGVAAALGTLISLLSGCAGSGTGTALDGGFTANSGGTYAPLRPHWGMSIIFVVLHNNSHSPVTLISVKPLNGRGLGSIVKISKLELTIDTPARDVVPISGYMMFPPVMADGKTCAVQRTAPVAGYQLGPNDATRVLELFEAVRPGRFQQRAVIVTYREGSSVKTQTLDSTITGSVRTDARYTPIDAADQRCMTTQKQLASP